MPANSQTSSQRKCSERFFELQAEAFPLFDVVEASHVRPAVKEILEDTNRQIDELEASAKPTWEALVEPLERLGDRLERAWGTVNHLKVL